MFPISESGLPVVALTNDNGGSDTVPVFRPRSLGTGSFHFLFPEQLLGEKPAAMSDYSETTML